MKTAHSFFTFFILISGYSSAINFQDALSKRWIKEETSWQTKAPEETSSLRHGSNLCVKVVNLTDRLLTIVVPSGTLFTALEDSNQDMLLTQNLQFELLPFQSVSRNCIAYCCEASDAAPNDSDKYTVKKAASEKLLKLADFINQKNYEGYGVQRAIWCISDARNLADISASDTIQLRELIYYTGKLSNHSNQDIEKAFHKVANGGRDFEKLITLELPVLTDETEMWIVVQNVNNITKQTVMKKQKVSRGIVKKQFGVSSIDLGKGEFTVRVYTTDKPVVEKKFVLNS